MDWSTSSRLRQSIEDLERLSGTLPREDEGFLSLVQTIQQLRFLEDTVRAGDARETVFVCSEQIASIRRSRGVFVRVGGLGLYEETLGIVMALQKEAHVFAAIQPQHLSRSKMIHG